MKKLLVLLFSIVLSTIALHAQNIAGTWGGELKPRPTVSIKLFFKINKTKTGYTATLDVPQQGAKDLPVSEATFSDNRLSLNISMLKASYEG